jgi:hypothetical protein
MAETTSNERVEADGEVTTVQTTRTDGSDPVIVENAPTGTAAPVAAPSAPMIVERPVERTIVESTAPTTTVSPGRGVLRLVLVALGAAGLFVGAFLEWVNGVNGIDLSNRVFFTTDVRATTQFLASAGLIAIVIGLVALLGLTLINGWVVRLAGIAGIIAFVLSVISMARAQGFSLPQDIGIGLWVLLAGSALTVIAGFVPTTRVAERPSVTTTSA